MPVIDTSFLVAAWNEDHPHHRRARDLLDTGATPLRINAGAVAEASRIIRRLAKDIGADGNAVARDFLHKFLHLPGAMIAAEHAEAAWDRYLSDGKLSFVDAWVKEQTVQTGQACWSFDAAIGDI